MTIQQVTPLVKTFGHSVIFADHLDFVPMMFQPIFFYPDWLFMTWPGQLFFAFITNTVPSYWDNIGVCSIGWAIVWYIGGVICAIFRVSNTFTEIFNKDLPFIFRIPYKIVCSLLFWHIVLARIIGAIIARNTTESYTITNAIETVVMTLMLIPPLIGLTITVVNICAYFLFPTWNILSFH